MPECPVCETTYVPGKSERCHVCGWQLKTSGFSMIGPVKVEHQISRSTLTQIEAWAHHMWTTIQQQKKRIAQLQVQSQPAHEPRPTVALPASSSLSPTAALAAPLAESIATRSTPPNGTVLPDTGLLQWVLGRLEVATQERSQLKFQLSQLRAEVQRLQEPSPLPHGANPALAPTATPATEPRAGAASTNWQQQFQQTVLDCQRQMQEAIAPWISTTQLQQQTLLTLQNTVQTLQTQGQDQFQTLQTTQGQLQDLTQKFAAQPPIDLENLTTVDWVSTQLATLQQQLEGQFTQQLTQQIEQQLTTVKTDWLHQQIPEVLREQLMPLREKVNELEPQLALQQAQQEQIQQLEQQLELQQTQQQQTLEQLSQRLNQLQSEVQQHCQQAEIATLTAQVQVLETTLTELSVTVADGPEQTSAPPGRSSQTLYQRY